MTVARRSMAVGVALLALAGCHPRSPQPPTREGAWAQARDPLTRRATLYDGFKHRATGTATYLSPALREARAHRLAEWFGWTPKELEDRLAAERAEAAAGEEFVLAFYAADPKANDLDAPRSVWRVALKVDGEDLIASRVTSVDSSANVIGLYPYVGPFDVVYRVTFPRPTRGAVDGKPFVLEIASALGRLSLDYGAPIQRPVNDPWQPVPPP